ncbi:2,5-diketo-D-gluconate reductase B [Neorhizobium galegae]|uniref:aldo/keto reductase n=1 Tax=Neorhizobium galegae TaxID=399 RepID=UPI00278163F9|nr:aldo/keto reductase [Neorhizobium galegae]MDQ0138387.1 2,5-diketo-D-gluconate reductase B [Neorhizobium galegae]
MKTEVVLPKIGLGTWSLRDQVCVDAVASAIELGYRFIDAAAFYGNEIEVGRAVRESRVSRDDLIISTKIWHTDLEPDAMRRSLETSLEKLQVDRIDLLLMHWPPSDLEIEGPLLKLASFVDAGLVSRIGVSNFPLHLLERAVKLSPVPLACNQIEMHLGLRQPNLLGMMDKAGIAAVAHCPLARGIYGEHPALQKVAAKYGTSWQQVALAWLIQQPNIHAIPGAHEPLHQSENLKALDLVLDEDDYNILDAVRDGRRVSTSPYPIPGIES